MAKFEYTEEVVNALVDAYTTRREAGERNAGLLKELAEDYDGLTVRSLRAKLMAEKAYIKDTEDEKASATEKNGGKAEKAPRVTKGMVAVAILDRLGLNASMADDLAKARADTLDALFAAVNTLTVETVGASDAELPGAVEG